ncbi:DNA cytosine methyltransferase [Cesiribacter sp. SM1]|uniref:DNA cytosine methyltransferase n=1 Tax=Cesiribacter sp. SM1 TaxID=2861196 RepID=UPI001CD37579|nr:DNA cytosine methyltransferase [Cesiribacter sp. SM1]
MKTFISLFCGCGGMDAGFEEVGFQGIGSYDFDPIALETYRSNLSSPAYNIDLSKEIYDTLKSKKGVDIVLSGSPCQGFSTIGKRKLDDKRNSLLIRGAEIAVELDAKVFISENVMGSIAGAHKQYWNQVESILNSNGYKVETLILDALKLGMGQRRKRVILIATKNFFDLKITNKNIKAKSLKTILHNLPATSKDDFIPFDKKDDRAIAEVMKPGQKLCDVRGGLRAVKSWQIPEVFGQTSESEKRLLEEISKIRRKVRIRDHGDADPVPIALLKECYGDAITENIDELVAKGYLKYKNECVDLSRTFNGKYRRLSWDEPSYTVDTNFGNPKYFIHPEEDRGMSVREAARIQGFSDNFEFSGSIHQKFKMIGNAVPPPMSKWIATVIKNSI